MNESGTSSERHEEHPARRVPCVRLRGPGGRRGEPAGSGWPWGFLVLCRSRRGLRLYPAEDVHRPLLHPVESTIALRAIPREHLPTIPGAVWSEMNRPERFPLGLITPIGRLQAERVPPDKKLFEERCGVSAKFSHHGPRGHPVATHTPEGLCAPRLQRRLRGIEGADQAEQPAAFRGGTTPGGSGWTPATARPSPEGSTCAPPYGSVRQWPGSPLWNREL